LSYEIERENEKLEDEINTLVYYTPSKPPQLLKHYHTPFKPRGAFNPRLSTPRKNKL
jgi:hypothetical protein|tara:strand:- start:403 stop:573 length:171 start_codon:yes stop_codon:yes gene_type:complete